MKAVVVGHVTKDIIRVPGRPDRIMTGGSAFYVSMALRRLGMSVVTVTKLAPADEPLLGSMRAAGIELSLRPSVATTVFENDYRDRHLSERAQRVLSIAAPFDAGELEGLAAEMVHLGPLTEGEMGPDVFRAARALAPTLSFDGQGILRRVIHGAVVATRPSGLEQLLAHVDVLKVDEAEARALAGEGDPAEAAGRLAALGPREVLLTFADRGSLVHDEVGATRVAAIAPRALVDATGGGDTYLAGYMAARLRSIPPHRAARFAAAAASWKLEVYGPLEKGWEAVGAREREAAAADHR